VRNVLLITGDPPKLGDYPDATAVFDVDSIGLTHLVARLNRGQDIGGQPIGQPTSFHIGVALNPAALDLDEELRRFTFKVDAGAEFEITQPIFDVDGFRTFLSRLRPLEFPVIAGLMPLASVRHAEFMANEVPGIHVPQPILDRMRRAETAGRAADEGLTIAREIAAEIRPLVRGVQISTAPKALDMALALVEAVGA
jgi:homocysteine S-methyltransferase